ncbi:MAG: hypothetical protein QXX95_03270 [Nitrososphaerales archaeon]
MLFIHLYDEPNTKHLDVKELASFLASYFPKVQINIRDEFLKYHFSRISLEDLARDLVKIKVKNPNIAVKNFSLEPLYGEIEVERRALKNNLTIKGALYDGFELSFLYSKFIKRVESNLNHVHICLTLRLLASYDLEDKRYHIRSIILSYPSLISIAGIVEGPAKPRDFYIALRSFGHEPLVWESLKESFKGSYIDYEDERITEVVKGYALQAIFYQWFGEVFCSNKECRLFNAHWQEEIIEAQIKSGRLCDKHLKMLEKFNDRW